MRKHRFIGFVLTAATVVGPLSFTATTPASAAVVISDGGAAWRLPIITITGSLPSAAAPSRAADSRQTFLSAFFAEFGWRLPDRLAGEAAQQPARVARLASSQLTEAVRHADAQRAAVQAATQSAAPRAMAAPVGAPAPAASPAPGDVWAELRDCESGGNYGEDTGNGFYGAYQFSPSTWTGLGYAGLPSEAPPAVQDAAAAELQARSGWAQWPGCSAKLGL
jgi:hypothetical protein